MGTTILGISSGCAFCPFPRPFTVMPLRIPADRLLVFLLAVSICATPAVLAAQEPTPPVDTARKDTAHVDTTRQATDVGVVVINATKPLHVIGHLPDVQESVIYAGKKTEMLLMDSLRANKSQDIERQILGRV